MRKKITYGLIFAIVITIGVEFGQKAMGYFSKEEIAFFDNYLKNNSEIANRTGGVESVEKITVGSEKSITKDMITGRYRFRINGKEIVGIWWHKKRNDTDKIEVDSVQFQKSLY